MADVFLKGADGEQNTYTRVETVSLISTDGETTETFVSERLILKQEQADWTEEDVTSPAYIKNKPTIFEAEDELPLVTTEDDGKLLGVLNGEWTMVDAPEVPEQVQSDWEENDEDSASYIKNRPFGIGEELHELIKESTLDFMFMDSYYVAQSQASDEQIALWENNDWNKAYVSWGGNEYSYKPALDGGKVINDDYLALTIQDGWVIAVVVSESSPSSFYVNVAMPIIEKIDPKYLPIEGIPEKTDSDVGKVLTVDANGVAVWGTQKKELPEATTADNGAFLRIVDGAPAWVTIQNAEDVAF